MTIKIEPFDCRNAQDHEYARLNECRNRIRAEILPDDPPIPLEEMVQGFKNFPAYIDHSLWTAWDADDRAIVAHGGVWLPLEDNLHMVHFNIEVLPEFRRQGLARRLLSRVVGLARKEKRRLMMCSTNDRIPAGAAFMTRIGAQQGLMEKTNQLVIDEVNRDLPRQWQERASERATGFEVGLWEGEYPDADIDAIVELWGLLNDMPFGDLDFGDFQITAEQLRQDEQSIFSRGYERWTLYVREKPTGEFAGYTEVLWNPNRPEIVDQLMTGVFPKHRNRGLGRWLKAAMLDKILEERPQAKYVRTENADINAPMLKINTELGFKPYFSVCVWQVETEQASTYLEGS
jgi:GNAT superfamily N-acetyltransferase